MQVNVSLKHHFNADLIICVLGIWSLIGGVLAFVCLHLHVLHYYRNLENCQGEKSLTFYIIGSSVSGTAALIGNIQS